MEKKTVDREEWTAPEVTELDIADETMSGDGTNFDGQDPGQVSSS